MGIDTKEKTARNTSVGADARQPIQKGSDNSYNIDTLKDRDNDLKELWEMFGDVPMNPETECMEEAFLGFPAGTHREEIWHWFDERYSKGVYALMYG